MSNTESLCNEGIDSVVTDTTRDTDEQATPKILCGLEGLGQKKGPDIVSPKWKAKLAPSIASTNQTSPVVPFQVTQKLKSSDTGGDSKQDSSSETMSPSILTQTDRWTESFSIIPSFVKKRDKTQVLESQSQSLLPQTSRQMENLTLQPSFIKTNSSGAATGSSAKSWSKTEETVGTNKQGIKISKTEKSKKKKTSETKKKSPQSSKSREKQQKKKKSYASSTHTCSSLKSLAKAVVEAQTSDTSDLETKKSPHKKRPSSLTIPTQSSFKSSSDTDDITTKINERIEKQLKDLEQAPRRKMLVIEAALVHCVTSVQDNIENKLAKLKHSFKTENAETLRKLLQTLKTTLGRLIEHHKQEREEFGTAVRASQSTQEETLMQQKTQLLELGKRQKKVFSLLTKQRELVTKLKEIETAKKVAGEDNITAEVPGIAESLEKVKIRKDINENEIIEDRDEGNVHGKKGERNDVVVNIIDETEAIKDISSKLHKVQSIQETVKNSQTTQSDLSNTPSLFKSRTEIVHSQLSPKSGSGLMDMLKLFGNRKKQASVTDAFGNPQPSSASATADQWSIGHDDLTAESSSGSFSEVEKGFQRRSDGHRVDKQFITSKVNAAKNPDEIKEIQKHSDLPENHIKEVHDKHYGSDKKKDTKTTSVSNKTPENIAQRKKYVISRKEAVKEVDFNVEKNIERQLNEKDAKGMTANKTKGKFSMENVELIEEEDIVMQTSGEENLRKLHSKKNLKEQITFKKVQNSGESKTDSELKTNIQGDGDHRANINDNDSNGEPFPKAFEPRRFYKLANKKTMKQLTGSEAVDVTGCVVDKDEDVMLSQDVTTIPDTQEPSTQDTVIGEQNTEDTGTTSIVQNRNKRKRSLTSDDKVPSRKKYTKMQETDERQKMDRSVCSPKTKDAEIQATASSDTRTAKMITRDIEKMPLVQSVNVVSFDNSVNHVSQIDSGKESASQRVFCDKSNDSCVKPLSERLWVDMMRKEPISNKPTGESFEITYYKDSKDNGLVSVKSPGVKLDKVIKRITEEKENLIMEKEKLKIDYNSPHDTNSRNKVMPAQARNLHINETCLHSLENRGKAEKSDPIMSNMSLHDAGLAVALPKPKEQLSHLIAKANHHPMFSPPRIPPQDEPYTDISPTATSMSSDVFVVKAKELERRMKRRIEMPQTQSMTNGKQSKPPKVVIPAKLENRSNKTVMVPGSFQIQKRSTEHWSSALPNKKSAKQPIGCQTSQNQSAEAGKTVTPKTLEEKLEAVINDVIKSSSATVDDHSQNQANMHRQQITAYNKNSQPLKSANSANFANNSQQNQVSGQFTADSQKQKSGQSVKIIYSGHALQQENSSRMARKVPTSAAKTSADLLAPKSPLPILKSLIKMGILRPGTNVLSAEVKGRTFWASLTPLGMIRTIDGQVFKTPMQWLSTLQGDGSLVKRRKSHEKIMYNGQPLLSYCNTTVEPSESYACEQATKGQEGSAVKEVSWEETVEGCLNQFLSTCRIRLLCKIDLIPCYDLPENFWANNFADVKLPSDIWECVDTWD